MSTRFDARDRLDTQALIGSSFASLRHCRYALLHITDPAAARGWLGGVLASGLLRSVADLGSRHDEAAALAFTWRGLHELGLREQNDYPFPSAFREGMGHRAQLFGSLDRAKWCWSDAPQRECEHQRGHERASKREFEAQVLLVHLRAESLAPQHSALPPPDAAAGLDARWVESCPSYLQPMDDDGRRGWAAFEPFGFRDGIAQPVIDGLASGAATQRARKRAGALFGDRVIAGGEIVLGHPNEYGERAYCPDVIGWPATPRAGAPMSRFGLNGSYVAVQQIRQHVAAWREFEQRHGGPSSGPGSPPSAVELMIGRRRDGTPLVERPVAASETDAFRYRVADREGFQCPRGAHVRRANPRDMLGSSVATGVEAAKLHRLLRRARVYRDGAACGAASEERRCGHDAHREHCGQGLFFMALGADLDRQFEFVQQRWIGNRRFNDLADESDPLLGEDAGRSFSVPGLPLGRRLENLPRFTETIGGGYFFMPGLAALRFIAM